MTQIAARQALKTFMIDIFEGINRDKKKKEKGDKYYFVVRRTLNDGFFFFR